MSKLVVLSAPSGTGKTTLCHRLLQATPELVLSISTTTRAPRGKEKHGVEYFFVTKEEFEKQIAAGRFAEWALVHGNYYGTSKDFVEKTFQAGKSLLLDIDVQGAKSLRATYPDQSVLLFIQPPSMEELERRLRSRATDSEEAIQKRLKNAADEIAQAKDFDHIITNERLDQAYFELQSIVNLALHGQVYAKKDDRRG